MRIVIDIPKEIYEASQILDVKYEDTVYIPLEVIKNGIPLPEHHGRLIDADALYDYFEYADYDFDKTIAYAPTIIEANKGGK